MTSERADVVAWLRRNKYTVETAVLAVIASAIWAAGLEAVGGVIIGWHMTRLARKLDALTRGKHKETTT